MNKQTPRPITFRPDDAMLAQMEAVKQCVGMGYSEQLRRAWIAWWEDQGHLYAKLDGITKWPREKKGGGISLRPRTKLGSANKP